MTRMEHLNSVRLECRQRVIVASFSPGGKKPRKPTLLHRLAGYSSVRLGSSLEFRGGRSVVYKGRAQGGRKDMQVLSNRSFVSVVGDPRGVHGWGERHAGGAGPAHDIYSTYVVEGGRGRET